MKCPSCLSTMQPERMMLNPPHIKICCQNKFCPPQQFKNSRNGKIYFNGYQPSVNIFLSSNLKSYTCNTYYLPFQENDSWYVLRGTANSLVDRWNGVRPEHEKISGIYSIYLAKDMHEKECFNESFDPIVSVNFIPLPINDEMHDHAEKLFHRLMNLKVFI